MMVSSPPSGSCDRIRQLEAWRTWLAQRSDLLRFGVTLVYDGWSPKLDGAKRDLRRWDAAVNRSLVGPRWHKPSDERERLTAFWFAEGAGSNLHWHGLLGIERPLDQLADAADRVWRRITTGRGNARVILNPDRVAAAVYVTKRLDPDHPEGLVEVF